MQSILFILLAIAVFLLIIMFHEFGHFITAKLFHVGVPEFSIGFGPAIFKKQKGETLYSLRAFPLGGYVKLEGENEESESKSALCNKPVWQRIIIVSAGAFINLLTGFLIYLILYQNVTVMPILKVESVTPGTPAYSCMQKDDVILSVNGNRMWYYKDFKFQINTVNPEKPLNLTVKRGNEKKSVTLTPMKDEQSGTYVIGITMKTEEVNFLRKFKYAFFETFFIIKVVLYSLVMLISGSVPLGDVSGPVGTVSVMTEAAREGFLSFITLVAMLTVNVGIFNLLPLPALDGGRVFFMLIELITGKPVNPKFEGLIHFAGFLLLILFMLFVSIGDVSELISGLHLT